MRITIENYIIIIIKVQDNCFENKAKYKNAKNWLHFYLCEIFFPYVFNGIQTLCALTLSLYLKHRRECAVK